MGCDFRSCSLLSLCSYSSLESDIFGLGHIETTASNFTTGTCAPPSHVFTRWQKLDVTILLDSEDSDEVRSLTRDFARLQNKMSAMDYLCIRLVDEYPQDDREPKWVSGGTPITWDEYKACAFEPLEPLSGLESATFEDIRPSQALRL